MGKLTESIVEFLSGERIHTPPAKSLTLATDGFTDCIAVMLAGGREAVTENLRAHVHSLGCTPISRELLGQQRTSVSGATLINVGAAHALDFDDYAYSNHVSALLVPAILAEAERTPCHGRDMLNAYLAGFEVWGAIMKREPDHLHSKGWHPTGTFGPLGVAAALSYLRKLTPEQCRNALGLAAANGGGVMDNFGTQAKSYQGARAAEAGVFCVEMALAGIDAGAHALDGNGGLLAALSPNGRADLESDADWLGTKWISATDSLNIKMHPTVGASQRGVDAAIQLHHDTQPRIDEIDEVVVRISEKHAAVMRFHQPVDALEAKFSIEFGVAAGLIAGRVGLAEVADRFVARTDVQALLRKVRIEVGPDNDPDYPVGAATDTAAYRYADGDWVESAPVWRFRGHGQNPMTESELQQKFMDCVVPDYGQAVASDLFAICRNMGATHSIANLPVLRPKV